MVLHRANFEIPAQFSFRPFSVLWEIRTAELVDWVDKRKPGALALAMVKPLLDPSMERERVSVHIDAASDNALGLRPLYELGHTVELYRSDIPSEVLKPHESRQTSPDISGRSFSVLVCPQAEFRTLFPPNLKPGDAKKNAWAMRAEFLNLKGDDDINWVRALRWFLDRWGLWDDGRGFSVESGPMPFLLAMPHLLKKRLDEYRKALQQKGARKWLSSAPPLSFRTIDEPPYFLVERFYCDDAIQATITIDRLAGRQFGFCKRCGKLFEHETRHKKNYCSQRCISAAGVKRWRDNQRKAAGKGAKRNAKG